MPQMTVFWDPRKDYPQHLLYKVVERAPFYAALALSTEGNEDGELTAEDFIVEVKRPGEANHFDERKENLDERTAQIVSNLEAEGLAPSALELESSFVWVRLSTAGYSELGRYPR